MRPVRTALAAALTAFLFLSAPVSAVTAVGPLLPPDTRPPSRPHHLHVTAIGSYSVGLAWNASTDNSGSLHYVITASNGYTMTVPQTSTSATFVGNLFPFNEYTFTVRAVDPSGNQSSNSNAARATLVPDTSVPGTPTVTVTDTGAHHVSLAWSSTDNDPYLSYFVYINGTQVGHSTTATSGTFYLSQVSTAYTVTVKARDHGINFSALSTPLVFSTEAVDASDVTAPTSPAAFDAFHYPFDRELLLMWTQSTDDVDPQQAIRYEIYVNGELAEIVIGTGTTISYGEFGFNTISIIAIDSAGNESAPTTITTDI